MVREVQTITTSASSGNLLGGTFSVAFDTRATGGSLQYSGEIAHNAAPTGGRSSMKEVRPLFHARKLIQRGYAQFLDVISLASPLHALTP